MTEGEARAWVEARFGVPRGTQVGRFVELLLDESGRQNLISASTTASVWQRHIVDSAQLIDLASPAAQTGDWIDIGAGPGLPGLVVAILTDFRVVLVEPRRRRCDFLNHVIDDLGLRNASVECCKIERVAANRTSPAVISARAVASLTNLLAGAMHLASTDTLWLLPKGRNAQSEVAEAQKAWQGSFHVEQSITQAESAIVVARGVRHR